MEADADGGGPSEERADSPAAASPLCLTLLRSACRSAAAGGSPLRRPMVDVVAADPVITDGPRRSRPLPAVAADPADADAFFEYDLESAAAAGGAGSGGGGDTGCSLTSPADGSQERSPSPPAAAVAAVTNGLAACRLEHAAEGGVSVAPLAVAAEVDGAAGGVFVEPARRHLYENPLASPPVAVPGGRKGRERELTARPEQSPSEKVDAWLRACDADSPAEEEAAAEGGDAPPAAEDEADTEDDADTEEALTDADELDIRGLLTRGCELLELERPASAELAERPDSLAFAAAAADEQDERDGPDEEEAPPTPDEDEGTGSASGASSEFVVADRFKRSSSLKSGKTPPLTPGRKKFVRFADALGLDLQQVRTFKDEVPTVPRSAYAQLDTDLFSSSPDTPFLMSFPATGTALDAAAQRQLVPMFLQPSSGLGFEERLRRDKVCLVSVSTHEEDWSVRGLVRVLNMDYCKSVLVRYTLDEWRTWSDAAASYVRGSCDGFSDRFCFTLYCSTLAAGQRLHFAVAFRCQGREFWDNNGGADYTVLCALAPGRGPPDPWAGARF